jgi:predicted RNase H-related nuclease YkuK (DUF458 family)
METMFGKVWKTVEGVKVENFEEELNAAIRGVQTIFVGTDSQQDALKTQYVTVIVIHNPGHGGRAFYTKETVPKIKSRRERLVKEAWLSVAVAMELSPLLSEEASLEIHLDANPNTKFESSKYVKEMVSMVVSQGFAYKIKPEAWAAMHVADHVVKTRVIGRA